MQLAEHARATWLIALCSVVALVTAGFAVRRAVHHRHHHHHDMMLDMSWHGHGYAMHGHGHPHGMMFERMHCMDGMGAMPTRSFPF